MDLRSSVIAEFGVDENTASKALGALFTSVRMAMDTGTFGSVAVAFPDASAWMREAPVVTGRTGELLALATPETVRRSLIALGFDDDQVDGLGQLIGSELKEHLPADTYDLLTTKLPLFQA
ncbi:MAG: hypothetical protein V3T56_06585 [Gemmatimonadales bacterium]